VLYDTIIVGAGPAGLNAALVLGRCRRKVLVLDAGRPRNFAARHLHNFLSRDGIPPSKLLAIGRDQLAPYDVTFRHATVASAGCDPAGFFIRTTDGHRARSRTILLATGVADDLPNIPNFRDFYGQGIHHCPYCDAWPYRDKPMAAYGRERKGLGLAMALLTWSKHITVVTHGRPFPRSARRDAERLGIAFREESITALESARSSTGPHAASAPLKRIIFKHGPPLPVSALFFNTDQHQRSTLPKLLGCIMKPDGGVQLDRRQRTGIPGLYLAGDASRDVQFAIIAAAEGARAAVAINGDLQRQCEHVKAPASHTPPGLPKVGHRKPPRLTSTRSSTS
jgi:thioredoxin reductase